MTSLALFAACRPGHAADPAAELRRPLSRDRVCSGIKRKCPQPICDTSRRQRRTTGIQRFRPPGSVTTAVDTCRDLFSKIR
jgi:hypothetical protein